MVIPQDTMFAAGLFTTTALVVYGLSGLVLRPAADPAIQRLKAAKASAEGSRGPRTRSLSPAVARVATAASRPFLPAGQQAQSDLRKRLSHAGLYATSAAQIVVGARVILMGLGAVVGLAAGWAIADGGAATYLMAAMVALAGYLAPTLWLSWKIRKRQAALERSLPDALDLMVVCVESGLTIDAAIQRVGTEIAMVHPDISRELAITHMETRVGVMRVDALRNLGTRTGSASLKSLSAVLVQTERFGTSIAQALRVHSESLRSKRQHRAEEQAAKTSVKLAFPVVLFIFPTLLVVLGGPAFILFFRSPIFSGQ